MPYGVVPPEMAALRWQITDHRANAGGNCDLCGTQLKHQVICAAAGRSLTVGYECAAHLVGNYARGLATKEGSWTKWKVSKSGERYKKVKGVWVIIAGGGVGYGMLIYRWMRETDKRLELKRLAHSVGHVADGLEEACKLAPLLFHIWLHQQEQPR
jgi:hypothetical protein